MTRLTEEQISRALHKAVPDVVDAAPGRAVAVRHRARRLRTRRWMAGAAGVLTLAAAVALPGLTLVGDEKVAPAGPKPTVSPTPPAQTPSLDPKAALAALRRPLSLPTLAPGQRCPVSQTRRFPGGGGYSGPFDAAGPGPVYLAGGSPVEFEYPPPPDSSYAGSRWGGQKVVWVIDSKYQGPVLLRGAQLDGPRGLRFDRYIGAFGYAGGSGSGPYRELAYLDPGVPGSGSLRSYPSSVRLRGPGCYAVQVDGEDFSEALVFRAVLQQP